MDYRTYSDRLISLFERQMNDLPLPWTVSDRLLRKVTADGEMMPFYGATTVIMLSDKDRNSCLDVRDHLFGKHGDRFVALAPHTYHLTIHALSNAYNVDGDDGMIRHSIERTEPQVKTEFQRIAAQFGDRSIRMRALGVSTGGKDIIGLKFVPEAKEDCELLIDLFDRLEAVYPLGESFVPHVSLGYHRVGPHSPEEVIALYDTLRRINRELEMTIELDVCELVYQHHYHMNDFRDVFAVKDFAALPEREANGG
ncbi:hypothetical protein B1A99_28345 [Cohnella sp. CIP 111063]|uniref:2'-5' RNA ligase family protein n=1 Tax=unclassified Cohnella TaxID=2636738 RepID=UPI000B8C1263|nr:MULTISPECIES: hypothetical protein [unclassified Cohnella]OXS53813.1 hypothetical protein B1A99_28345 [Cohnella sp. CIP 111063]PRX62392.1 hypothetical protein B0G52_12327 [Cohnella sp. SGD-V74]